jgi:hypothetical protein
MPQAFSTFTPYSPLQEAVFNPISHPFVSLPGEPQSARSMLCLSKKPMFARFYHYSQK